jgi:hypothetical protein
MPCKREKDDLSFKQLAGTGTFRATIFSRFGLKV